MKRLPIMIICVGLLTAACGTDAAGSLGPAPAGTARPSASAATGGRPVSAAPTPGGQQRPSAGGQSPGGQPAGSTSPGQATPGQIGLQVWFTQHGKLFVTGRTVPATPGAGRAAVDRLLAGPSAAEYAAALRSQIPAGTALLGLSVSAGIATADLSSAFESGAGPSTMPARIAQVVYTLTQFPTVTGVRFQIDGHGVTMIGGVPVQSPQTRAMYGGYLPAITVQSPVIGQQVTSPVTVSGTADVFEAVVSVRILDSAGREIARTFTTASCGTGCRGDYSVTIPYPATRAGHGTIEVFESSAKDGAPVNVERIPVMIRPASGLSDGDLGGQRQGRGGGAGGQDEGARLEDPAAFGPVLEGALGDLYHGGDRRAGVGVGGGEADQPLHRALYRGARPGRVELDDLPAAPRAGIADGDGDRGARQVDGHGDGVV